MRFAAVMRDFMRSPQAALASDIALASWLKLYSYAAEIEQGGIIPRCDAYTDREWLAIAQVSRAGVDAAFAAGLIVRQDDGLLVVGYDLEGETKVQATRERNRENGKKSAGRPKKPTGLPTGLAGDNPSGSPSSVSGSGTSSSSSSSSKTEPKNTSGGGTTLSSFSEREKEGKKKKSYAARAIDVMQPLWCQHYGIVMSVSIEDRRAVGAWLKGFGEGREEEVLRALPQWYRDFLNDPREAYHERRHALTQFLSDCNQHRVGHASAMESNYGVGR